MRAPDELPRGMVTFCFTDIEGSTRMLRELGDSYAIMCERHFELMRRAWELYGGFEISQNGDSTFVAFTDAESAVAACGRAQVLLDSEDWPEGSAPRVRMGIHTGLAFPRAGDYMALAVHQAARIMSAAHGQQVLVSADAADQVQGGSARHGEETGISLKSIGRYRVRDFDHPQELFQLAGPGLATEFPAVRALPADRHNLVTPATPLIGREGEVSKLARMMVPNLLLTLTGPAGVGKTRLANEVGRRVSNDWRDGVWMVDLAPIDDPSLIGAAIGEALGTPRSGGDRLDEVLSHQEQSSALLVLDNCEHLKRPMAMVIDRFLTRCPGCAVLATSREPLGIGHEMVERVPALPLPPSRQIKPDVVLASPAVQLLVERASAAGSDVVVGEANAELFAQICSRLDGLPLALELAAVRLSSLGPAELLASLDDRLSLLRSRDPTRPERQRTMEAALEWSERLLTESERRCLHRLGAFRSSFSAPAANATSPERPGRRDEASGDLWSLVDKSLVVADLSQTETRYRLLESVREYAARRLDDSGQSTAVATRLADWYLEQMGPAMRHRPGWTSEVGVELDNLRGLIAQVGADDPERAQMMAYTVGRFLDSIGSYREGIGEMQGYIDWLREPTPTRVSLLTTLADLFLRCSDLTEAERVLAEADQLRAVVGSVPQWDDVAVERTRGDLACRLGDPEWAIVEAERVLSRDVSLAGRARMFNQMGIASTALGNLEMAWSAFVQEADIYRQLGDRVLEEGAEGNLAEIALRMGDYAAAARHNQVCFQLAREIGSPVGVACSLIVAARIASTRDEWLAAVQLHAHADRILEHTGIALYELDRLASDDMLQVAKGHLGERGFAHAMSSGAEMELTAASSLADQVLTDVASQD